MLYHSTDNHVDDGRDFQVARHDDDDDDDEERTRTFKALTAKRQAAKTQR